ncbi:MAG: putative RNA-binding protein [Candidatus Nanosalina sp. J07AB43]|nr:MAG: putative RNA-binding protein [Candidatus Nanosalina sp. J07AB43]
MSDKDEYIMVLEFLEHGHSDGRDDRVAQGIGKDNYSLLEVVMREDERPKGGEELYIGDGDRDKVEFIKRRIGYDELTGNAQKELKYVLQELISQKEDEFVDFYNEATPVTPRRHAFELLPGIGTKHMQALLDEREKEEFESFEDIKERVPSVPDPQKTVNDRILEELKGETKNKLFVD